MPASTPSLLVLPVRTETGNRADIAFRPSQKPERPSAAQMQRHSAEFHEVSSVRLQDSEHAVALLFQPTLQSQSKEQDFVALFQELVAQPSP